MKMTSDACNGSRSGYVYTISIIILTVPLVLLLVFYTGTNRTRIDDTSERMRCNELYFFVEDVGQDMERAMLIFGRRAAIYAIDDIVTNNRTLANYTYHNCTPFVFGGNGSEAAIAELVMCGTLYGNNVTYMMNHTLPVWMDRLDMHSEEMGYNLTMQLVNISVLPYDAWNFAITIDIDFEVSDSKGLCYYEGENTTATSITDIIGLEDPLYPLHTNNKVSKYIYNCSNNISVSEVAGCSTEDWGNGTGPGNVVFYSDIKDNPGLGVYCSTEPNVNNKILVMDMAFGNCQGLEYDCFDITDPDHLGGVIDYAKNNPESSFIDKCNVTIPWISATGKLDNETQYGTGHQRDPDCGDSNITRSMCVLIKNIPGCGIHEVLVSSSSEDLNTQCYEISNITQYWPSCSGEEYLDGPSFFDRLDGRLNLSDKYVNQSLGNFGNRYIGIETLVSPYDLADHGVSPNQSLTWVDYLYWSGKTGCEVDILCNSGSYALRLDCPHAYYYSEDTSCVNASGVAPVSGVISPSNDSLVMDCAPFNITGSAEDCDGSVESVWVSINNGEWQNSTWDGSNWTYEYTPTATNRYDVKSRAVDNDGIYEDPLPPTVIFVSNCSSGDNTPPSDFDLFSPSNGSVGVPRAPDFYWDEASDASGVYRYEIQIDLNPPDWSGLEADEYVWDTEYHQGTDLQNNKWYAWRVRAQDNAGNWGPWSEVWTFKT